jgi:type I restriction enzyme S subunit
MGVKPVFQQTAVGMIPKDWKVSTAADVCELVVDCKNRTPPVLVSSEYAVVRTPNVRSGKFVWNELRFTDKQSFREWTARAIPQIGDILITREAPLGEVCLVPSHIRVCLGQRMMLYRPDRVKLDSRFLLYALMSSGVRSNLLKMIGGSTVGHAKVDDIRNLQVPIPPTKLEQEAIAEALGNTDALIESLEQLLAKKRDLKQGTMQELLIPKPGDEVRLLRDVSSLKGRIGWQGLKQTEFTTNEDEPFLITGMNFKDGAIRWNEVYHITKARYEMAPEIQLRPDDVLMTKDGTIGKVLYIDTIPHPGKASLNSHLLLFRPIRSNYYPKYLYYQFSSQRFRDFVEQTKSGTTFFGLSQAAVGTYPVLLPPIEVQSFIATVLSDMDSEIAALEAKLAKARRLKQGIMRELLTGRVRLV